MPAQNIVPFDFNGNAVRVVEIDGSPWFVAKDICDLLGLQNIRQNLGKLDEDEKGVCTVYTVGGNQELATVSESGMYSLVLKSRKPEAKAFCKWVTGTVLVSLRKTGTYSIPQSAPAPEPERQLPPKATVYQYADVIERLGMGNSPILRSLLEQRMAEELGSGVPVLAGPRLALVTVRASELGIPQSRIGTGSSLGKYIKGCGFPVVGQSPHGRYMVNTYEVTPSLDAEILSFFGEMSHYGAA